MSPRTLISQAAMLLPLPPATLPREWPPGKSRPPVGSPWLPLLWPWGKGDNFHFAHNPKDMKGCFLNPHSTAKGLHGISPAPWREPRLSSVDPGCKSWLLHIPAETSDLLLSLPKAQETVSLGGCGNTPLGQGGMTGDNMSNVSMGPGTKGGVKDSCPLNNQVDRAGHIESPNRTHNERERR